MSADLLRLILLVSGIALILGIYLWDRYKKNASRVHASRKAQAPGLEEEHEPETGEDDAQTRVEPVWNREEMIAAEESSDSLPDHEPASADALANDEKNSRFGRNELIDQAEFSFTAEGSGQDSEDAKIPVKVFQINIVSKSGRFSGEAIKKVARKFGLRYGDMSIFHCYTGSTDRAKVLFSLTSMLEPGIFPSESLEDYSTPGLTLFMQLPGPMDSLTIFTKMLSTAEDIAVALDASLQDESHSDLTKQTIEHMRVEVLEHRRQVQIAHRKQ